MSRWNQKKAKFTVFDLPCLKKIYRCLTAKVGCVSGLQIKNFSFLFGTPLNLHYLCTALNEGIGV